MTTSELVLLFGIGISLRLCRLVCSVYDHEDPQARRIAANIAKVPELRKRPTA